MGLCISKHWLDYATTTIISQVLSGSIQKALFLAYVTRSLQVNGEGRGILGSTESLKNPG